jgi:vanillate monooxygenase ferredoxin subunit
MVDPWLEVEIVLKEREAEGVVRLELTDRRGMELPGFTAGAHIDVEVTPSLTRQYSLCNSPLERHRYVIGVLREQVSRGGSQAVHDSLQVGHTVRIRAPRNHFALDPTASRYILFAGGIGVTPILAMAEHLSASARPFELHYCARTRARAAFVQRMELSSFAARVHLHFDDGPPEKRLEIKDVLGSTADDAHLYVCGPPPSSNMSCKVHAHEVGQKHGCIVSSSWPQRPTPFPRTDPSKYSCAAPARSCRSRRVEPSYRCFTKPVSLWKSAANRVSAERV